MNRKKFIGAALAVLVSSTLSFGQTTSTKCTATTKKNVQCKNTGWNNSSLCYLHNPNYVKKNENSESTQCNGISKSTNNQCKRKTKNINGFCHSHTPKSNK